MVCQTSTGLITVFQYFSRVGAKPKLTPTSEIVVPPGHHADSRDNFKNENLAPKAVQPRTRLVTW
jgi:hypothetical protein